MSWLSDALLIEAIANAQKERAGRDGDGNPICGGCRNRVDENARTCEHCGSTLQNPRRVNVVGAVSAGVGGSFWAIGVPLCIFGYASLSVGAEYLPVAVGMLFVGLILTGVGAIPLYVAYRLKTDRPVREVDFGEQMPSFVFTLANRVTRRV
jgi:hypothetical protein